jgi:hypothetical protein
MKRIIDTPNNNMSTLLDCLNHAVKKGYTENFQITNSCLSVHDDRLYYHPSDVSIKNFYRFEGQSDPQENSILYLIETCDGRKGTVIDAYGIYADSRLSRFMHDVESIHKIQKSKKKKFSLLNLRMNFLKNIDLKKMRLLLLRFQGSKL